MVLGICMESGNALDLSGFPFQQNCIESCSKLGDCVICKARGASDCQSACGSERNVTLFNNRTVVELTQEYPSKDLRRCQVEYQSCQLPFYLDSLLLGTETNMVLSIYVDRSSGTYQRIQSSLSYLMFAL